MDKPIGPAARRTGQMMDWIRPSAVHGPGGASPWYGVDMNMHRGSSLPAGGRLSAPWSIVCGHGEMSMVIRDVYPLSGHRHS